MMTTLIDQVVVLVPELQTAIADLNAKIGQVTTVDLTPETDRVNALIVKLTGILPAPELTPAPPVETPVTTESTLNL
jgi:hypothetical protein